MYRCAATAGRGAASPTGGPMSLISLGPCTGIVLKITNADSSASSMRYKSRFSFNRAEIGVVIIRPDAEQSSQMSESFVNALSDHGLTSGK